MKDMAQKRAFKLDLLYKVLNPFIVRSPVTTIIISLTRQRLNDIDVKSVIESTYCRDVCVSCRGNENAPYKRLPCNPCRYQRHFEIRIDHSVHFGYLLHLPTDVATEYRPIYRLIDKFQRRS